MTRAARERWTFTLELPPDVQHGSRFIARLLKWLWRSWRVRCVAVLDTPADPPVEKVRPTKENPR
jgi:hypothetical protein